MKRFVVFMLVVGLVVGGSLSGAAQAGKRRKPRVVKEDYISFPAVYWSQLEPVANVGGVAFDTKRHERYIDVKITDATGLPVPGFVGQDPDGDDSVDGVFFCGSIKDVSIQGGVEVVVFTITSPVCLPDLTTPAMATTGTVKGVLSTTP